MDEYFFESYSVFKSNWENWIKVNFLGSLIELLVFFIFIIIIGYFIGDIWKTRDETIFAYGIRRIKVDILALKKLFVWLTFHPVLYCLFILFFLYAPTNSIDHSLWTLGTLIILSTLCSSILLRIFHSDKLEYISKSADQTVIVGLILTLITFTASFLTDHSAITKYIIKNVNNITNSNNDPIIFLLFILIYFLPVYFIYNFSIRSFTRMFIGQMKYNKYDNKD